MSTNLSFLSKKIIENLDFKLLKKKTNLHHTYQET